MAMEKEMVGFQTSGYIDKKGTQDGDMTKFNVMPPGYDIANQPMADIRDMKMVKLVDVSYPGDGY
jgi:hypothetical protein